MPMSVERVWFHVIDSCGLTGVGKALWSFPKWELVGAFLLLIFYVWWFRLETHFYLFGLLFGLVGGVQVGRRVERSG